ncbi:DUF858-domain-containing protein [Flagelloscypha sp. PMI_526]|nr:DUF858-domain-containing protein [Flagelloscypha sp. PMI_526]
MSRYVIPEPNIQDGIDYWANIPASYNGVLGGFGEGTLPRIDSLGSRQFLLNLLPELCTVPSAIAPLSFVKNRRFRALDVGAGVGRVTSDVLLHLFDDVVIVEPVESFLASFKEAILRAQTGQGQTLDSNARSAWPGLADATKSVLFLLGPLQAFSPLDPLSSGSIKKLGHVGYVSPESDLNSGFDVAWCQWCLGHLSDPDLISFLKKAKNSLRDPVRGLIGVKENLCSDGHFGEPRTVFDQEDSSLTRSDMAWKSIFSSAGLIIVKEKVQDGLPEGLYVVKMYVLWC